MTYTAKPGWVTDKGDKLKKFSINIWGLVRKLLKKKKGVKR